MSDAKQNFQIWLSPAETQTLNARAVSLTVTGNKPHSLQDVVRKWIKAGCPVPNPKKLADERQH